MRGETGLAVVCGSLLLVSGAEILSHGPLTHTDNALAHYYLYNGHQASIHAAQWLAQIGQPSVACLVVGGLAAVLAVRSQRIGPILAALVGLGIVGLGTLALKTAFPHPSIYFHRPGSFPSGHTAVAVVSAGIVVWLLAPRLRNRLAVTLAAAGSWGALMAWGRLVLLAHWLSDVIAGWALGMIALVIALRVIDVATTPRDAVALLVRRAGLLRGSPESADSAPVDR